MCNWKYHPEPYFEYSGGPVSETLLVEALNFLVEIAPDPRYESDIQDYWKNEPEYRREINLAKAAIKRYGEDIKPRTLEAMQDEFYRILEFPRFSSEALSKSIVYTTMNNCWDGIGKWCR